MATVTQPAPTINREESRRRVAHPLQRLRGYIRLYVTVEAVAIMAIFLAAWFWIGLALDFGTFEIFALDWVQILPYSFRVAMLVLPLAALVGILATKMFVRLAREFNDRLHSAIRAHPDRYAAFAHLPTTAPAAAADELERTVQDLGFKGALINGVTDGRFLLMKAANESRYRQLVHVDVMDTVTFCGASSRFPLAAYALGYGWRSPKADMNGATVSVEVRKGRIVDVVRYCAGDVLATAHIHERMTETSRTSATSFP